MRRSTRARTTSTAGASRPSPRDGLSAYFALSPVSGLSCHRCRAHTGGPDRRQGRGARTTRLRRTPPAFRRRGLHRADASSVPSQPAPRFVTTAKRPSWWCGLGGCIPQIRIPVKRNILILGLDTIPTNRTDLPVVSVLQQPAPSWGLLALTREEGEADIGNDVARPLRNYFGSGLLSGSSPEGPLNELHRRYLDLTRWWLLARPGTDRGWIERWQLGGDWSCGRWVHRLCGENPVDRACHKRHCGLLRS